jgi:hypothetical protein
VVNGFAAVAWARPSVGCAIHPTILQIAAVLYLVYGTLFVRLFVERYVRPRAGKERSSERRDDVIEGGTWGGDPGRTLHDAAFKAV